MSKNAIKLHTAQSGDRLVGINLDDSSTLSVPSYNLHVDGTFGVEGATTLKGGISGNISTTSGNISTTSGSLYVGGTTTLVGNAQTQSDLQVDGDLHVNGSTEIDTNLQVDGNTTLNKNLQIPNSTSIVGIGKTATSGLEIGLVTKTTQNIQIINTTRGLDLTDSSGAQYGGIYDNGSNLWIGSASSTSHHHVGSTYISSGYNGSAGNATAYISVPNASNTNATNYGILHTGNYDDYLDPRYYPANGKTIVTAPNCNSYKTIGQAIFWGNGQAVTNGPSSATTSGSGKVAGRLTVEGTLGSDFYLRQVYREYNNNKRWERYSTDSGSSWSSWARIDGWAMQYDLALSVKQTKTSTVNIAAGGTQWFYYGGSTAPAASTIEHEICIIGWYVTGTNASLCFPYAQTNASVALKNTSTSRATGIAVTFYCLCNA